MIEKSGVYGSNVGIWSDRDKKLFKLGRFRWAVVRTDTDVRMADFAKTLGATVIMQFPDEFNTGRWPDPGDYARHCYEVLSRFTRFSNIVTLDNEPNVHPTKCGRWYAEEFCRWYRAVVACFRYLDPASHWKLLFPGLCPLPWHNVGLWYEINEENIVESDGIAWHAYWQTLPQFDSTTYGENYLPVPEYFKAKGLYITEYGVAPGVLDEEDKISLYPEFIKRLPDYVHCACVFILGGTHHWRDWWITERIALALGELGEEK